MWFMVMMTVFVCVESGPIIIRSSISKNEGQKRNGDLFDASHNSGLSSLAENNGFDNAHDVKFINAEDVGNFEEELNNQKHHLDENQFSGQKFHKNAGDSVSDFGNKIAHKKGHHKTGFHNTYHKDESGSNSSFYDDSDDSGDERIYDSKKGTYADIADQRHKGGKHDSSYIKEGQGKRGNYNNGGGYKHDNGRENYYNQRKYADDREKGHRQNAYGAHGEGGNYQEAYDERRPYYNSYGPYKPHPYPYHDYDDYYYDGPNPHPIGGHSKRTITIYEDPRYIGDRFEDNDYVQLDYRRPIRYDTGHYNDYY